MTTILAASAGFVRGRYGVRPGPMIRFPAELAGAPSRNDSPSCTG